MKRFAKRRAEDRRQQTRLRLNNRQTGNNSESTPTASPNSLFPFPWSLCPYVPGPLSSANCARNSQNHLRLAPVVQMYQYRIEKGSDFISAFFFKKLRKHKNPPANLHLSLRMSAFTPANRSLSKTAIMGARNPEAMERNAHGRIPVCRLAAYSETRVAVSRNLSTQVDAANRERRPRMKLQRVYQLWFRSRTGCINRALKGHGFSRAAKRP